MLVQDKALEDLANQLRAAAKAYYNTDEQLMSDDEYDAGIEALQRAVHEDPSLKDSFKDLLEEVAAGQGVVGEATHGVMMGSLAKAGSLDSVRSLVEAIAGPVVVEPKMDGLAIRAVYEDGKLVLAALRGDGASGEDVTANAKALGVLPEKIDREGSYEIRGEVFMDSDLLEKASAIRVGEGKKPYVSERNAAAGIIRRGSSDYKGMLRFAAYDLQGSEEDSYTALLKEAEALGFPTAISMFPGLPKGALEDVEKVVKAVEAFGEERVALSNIPTDGAVVKADLFKDRERLGYRTKSPKWAVAYKYDPASAVSIVRAITTSVGRTGRLAFRIQFDPVKLGKSTVSFASGHNVGVMLQKDIRVGDLVNLVLARDVIPYVDSVVPGSRGDQELEPWCPPETDELGNPWDKSTELWRSTSPELSVHAALTYAVSRDVLDIEGIGSVVAGALVDYGNVSSFLDLFTLSKEDLAELPLDASGDRLLGPVVGEKIWNEIQKAKSAEWGRFITAMGIRATGRTMSRRIAAVFTSLDLLRAATVDQLQQVEGIGRLKAETILEGIREREANGMFDAMVNAGVTVAGEASAAAAAASGPLSGEVVVVTGKVPGLGRTEVRERIEALGGKSSSSFSSKTTLLVAEAGSTSSKVKAAKAQGTRIITPDEFLALS